VTRKYRARRYEALWACQAALPTFRYPQPFPVPNQSWSAKYAVGQMPPGTVQLPIVSVRVGNRNFQLRLKSHRRYRRQIAAFAQMLAGTAIRGQLTLYRRRDQLLCMIVSWLPRFAPKVKGEGALAVRTASDAMLVALDAKDERTWTYNADHIRRWSAEYYEQLQRWAEDTKAEQRPVPSFAERRAAAAAKFHNRMQTAAYQAAAYVAGYAGRRHFATVRYDDREKSWCPRFPWKVLQTRLSTVLGERGIGIEILAGEANEENQEPVPEG
jgi:hypothetical protein